MKDDCFYFSRIEFFMDSLYVKCYLCYSRDDRELSYIEKNKWGTITKLQGIKLTEHDAETIGPLLRTSLYEEFRKDNSGIAKHDDSSDEFLGYMDEGAALYFTGISDSPFPLISIDASDYYYPHRIYHQLETKLSNLLNKYISEEENSHPTKIKHRKRKRLEKEHILSQRPAFTFSNNYTQYPKD